MTKQVVSGIEEITPKTFLKRFDFYNAYIEKLRSENIQSGLDIKRTNFYVPQDKLFYQGIYEKFIKEATHPRTQKWNTIHSLLESEALSDLDVERFEGNVFPTFVLNRLTRVKSPSGDHLERFITIRALDRNGNVIQKSIMDADYYHLPAVIKKSVPEDMENPEDKQLHINVTPSGGVGWGLEPRGQKVNFIEFSESNTREILKQTAPVGDFSDRQNGCSLTLVKIGETQNTTTVRSLSEFLEPFEDIWTRNMNPNSGAKIDIRNLVDELQKRNDVDSKEHTQYG